MAYLILKTLHIVFIIAWMSAVFYLPRILVNIAEAGDEPAVKARLELMGRRLYLFGHNVFGVAFALGLTLWQGWRLWPASLPNWGPAHWLWAKIGVVLVILAHFIWAGRTVKKSVRGEPIPSARTLRMVNEIPVLLLIAVEYLVLAKPF